MKPNAREAMIYSDESINPSPPFSSVAFSFIKVEKVVNPPQKPVVSRRRVDVLIPPFSPGNEENIPIRKQPKTFTTSVPNGKEPAIAS